MKSRIAFLCITIVVLVAAASVFSRAVEVRVESNLTFTTVGNLEIKGDMYIPEGKGPFPGVLYIHGGGFVAGSKDFGKQAEFVRFLAENGFIVFSANYRLIQEGGLFPNSTRDVKCALCWFKKNGVKYGLDPVRVGVLGESAGAYLAAMIGGTAGMREFAAECEAAQGADDSVVAAVAVYPPTDFTTFDNNLSRMIKNEMLRAGKIKVKDKEIINKFMIEQSPIKYVKTAKPILILHGANDILVPVDQSRSFSKALKDAGRDVEYVEYEDAPHGFFSEKPDMESSKDARKRAVEFLKKMLATAK